MAYLNFARGTQHNLDLIKTGGAVDGTFYLTSDTNRLYVGTADKNAVPVAESIVKVADFSSLPQLPATGIHGSASMGTIYYLISENILCIPNSTGNAWIQINADTNNDTYVTDLTITEHETETNTFVFSIKQSKKDEKSGAIVEQTPIVANFTVPKSMINDTAVSINSSVKDNAITFKTEGNGSDGDGVILTGGSNVTITSTEKNKVNINSKDTTYSLESAADTTGITLSGSDGYSKEVSFKAGKNLSISGAEADQITFSHSTVATTPTTSTETPVGGEDITMIDSVTIDNGHITGYKTKTVKLPVGAINTAANVSITGGSVEFSISDSTGASISGTAENALYYTVNGEKVYNQGSFEFYTKNEIDGKINGINAMVYRGTVGGEEASVVGLPVTNVSIGDTYMVKIAGTYGGVAADVGDLFIATGTEENNVITEDTLKWTYVPSGDDTDTQYQLNIANNTITLSNNVDAGLNTIVLEPGQDIIITTKEDNSGVIFAHREYVAPTETSESPESPSQGGQFSIVSGVEVSNGHITGVKTKKITLPTAATYTLPVAEVEAGTSASISLSGSDGSSNEAIIEASTDINVTVGEEEENNHIIVAHKSYTYTPTETTPSGNLTANSKLKVITGANVTNGHLTSLTTTEYTLPQDTTYTPSIVVAKNATENSVNVSHALTSNDGASQEVTFKVSSSNLKISANGDNGFSIDYEWGTF